MPDTVNTVGTATAEAVEAVGYAVEYHVLLRIVSN